MKAPGCSFKGPLSVFPLSLSPPLHPWPSSTHLLRSGMCSFRCLPGPSSGSYVLGSHPHSGAGSQAGCGGQCGGACGHKCTSHLGSHLGQRTLSMAVFGESKTWSGSSRVIVKEVRLRLTKTSAGCILNSTVRRRAFCATVNSSNVCSVATFE